MPHRLTSRYYEMFLIAESLQLGIHWLTRHIFAISVGNCSCGMFAWCIHLVWVISIYFQEVHIWGDTWATWPFLSKDLVQPGRNKCALGVHMASPNMAAHEITVAFDKRYSCFFRFATVQEVLVHLITDLVVNLYFSTARSLQLSVHTKCEREIFEFLCSEEHHFRYEWKVVRVRHLWSFPLIGDVVLGCDINCSILVRLDSLRFISVGLYELTLCAWVH